MPSSSPHRPTPPRTSPLSRHSPSADRSLHRAFRDHNENGPENGTRSAERASQSGKAQPPKRAWVTHFSKAGLTPSPKKKILTEHKESNSPARARSNCGSSDLSIDKQRDLTPEPQRRENSSPVKGVAELSKRIQQFLEDQESLLGVRNGSPYDSVEGISQISTEPRLHNSLSPYDPYHSPFCNRPQFLRWHGKASPADVVGVKADNAEELPLFDDDQNIVSLAPKSISYPAILPPANAPKFSESSPEEREPALTERASEQTKEWNSAGEKYLVVLHSENTTVRLESPQEDAGDEGAAEENEEAKEVGVNGCIAVPATIDEEGGAAIPVPEPHNAILQEQESGKEDDAGSFGCSEANASGKNLVQFSTIDPTVEDCKAGNSAMHSVELEEVEFEEDSPGRTWLAKNVILASVLTALLTVALLASGSPALLPSSLTNNLVSAIWHESKYTQPALAILNRFEGLWSAEPVSEYYLPVDIRVIQFQVEALFKSVKDLSKQGGADLSKGIRRLSASFQEWWAILEDLLLLGGNPEFGESVDQGGLFDADWIHEWIEESEFEERWGNEEALQDYHYWELLPEYDIQAANEAVLGWMPESLRRDLQRNFSRLSDSLEVNALLDNLISDLVKSKLGTTKERSEILHRPEEHDEISPDVSGIWMHSDDKVAVDGSFKSLPDCKFTEQNEEPETKIQIDTIKKGYSTDVSLVIDNVYDLSAHIEFSMRDTASKADWQFANRASSNGDAVSETGSVAENRLKLDGVVTGEPGSKGDAVAENDALSQTDLLHGKEVTNRKFWDWGKIVVPVGITVLLLVLGRYYVQSINVSRLPPSSVQFLRKSHPVQRESSDDKLHQQSKGVAPVTMIEELNDRLASMLQSPELNANRWRSPSVAGREEEELIRSPLVGSVESPYGSFTALKLVSKKEGQGVESKLTPVRRSNRLRNQINMSPNSVNRIAISPP